MKKKRDDGKLLPYTISRTKDGLYWYCHRRGFEAFPVFGSIGTKDKAKKYCDLMNRSKGAKD